MKVISAAYIILHFFLNKNIYVSDCPFPSRRPSEIESTMSSQSMRTLERNNSLIFSLDIYLIQNKSLITICC